MKVEMTTSGVRLECVWDAFGLPQQQLYFQPMGCLVI